MGGGLGEASGPMFHSIGVPEDVTANPFFSTTHFSSPDPSSTPDTSTSIPLLALCLSASASAFTNSVSAVLS